MADKARLALILKRRLKPHLRSALWFSVAFNVLLLVQPLYMLQVYDRVLTSGSYETLILLSLLALVLLIIFGFADAGRRRVFGLIGRDLGNILEEPVFDAGMRAKSGGGKLETAVADLGRVQSLFSAGTISPFFDAPFVPMFVALVFLIHPMLGFLTLGGAIALLVLAILAERSAKPLVDRAGNHNRNANSFIAGISRQFSAIMSMGMNRSVYQRWQSLRDSASDENLEASRVANRFGAISKASRQSLQVAMLGLAAYLVLQQQISAGAIIAASILSGRALAPLDQAIGGWKPLMQARRSFLNLEGYVGDLPGTQSQPTRLPAPEPHVTLEELEVAPPGAEKALLPKLKLEVQPGNVLLVIGPSGRGKTSLLQTLAGIWSPFDGAVRLGGIDMHGWDPTDRGRHVGYLPQMVELLPGTVAENIQRYHDDTPEAMFETTQRLGFHEAILAFPEAYETVHAGQGILSAGQRQMVGLARAIYGDPELLLLDEPNAHLDAAASASFISFLGEWKKAGKVAIIASHDLRMLPVADNVLELGIRGVRYATRDAFFKAISGEGKATDLQKAELQKAAQ